MSTQIVGGRRNNPMNIGVDGRARVLSIRQTSEFNAALNESAYHLLAEVNLIDSSLTPLLYLKNTVTGFKSGAEQVLCIQEIIFSGDANLHYEIFTDETYTSGGTSVAPINKFIGSTRHAQATIYDNSSNNLVLAGDGAETDSLFIGANTSFVYDFHGAYVLRGQRSISIKVEGANTNKARIGLNFFYLPLSVAE